MLYAFIGFVYSSNKVFLFKEGHLKIYRVENALTVIMLSDIYQIILSKKYTIFKKYTPFLEKS